MRQLHATNLRYCYSATIGVTQMCGRDACTSRSLPTDCLECPMCLWQHFFKDFQSGGNEMCQYDLPFYIWFSWKRAFPFKYANTTLTFGKQNKDNFTNKKLRCLHSPSVFEHTCPKTQSLRAHLDYKPTVLFTAPVRQETMHFFRSDGHDSRARTLFISRCDTFWRSFLPDHIYAVS